MRKRYFTQKELNQQKFQTEWYLTQGRPKFYEVYPSVVECKILYSEDVILARHYHIDNIYEVPILSASSRVTIDCINPDCSKGVFDLSQIIRQMVDKREKTTNGKMVCDGYQDAERYGQHQCLCKLEFTIEIQYRDEN